MPKNEQGQASSNKPNKGQDENLHTFVGPNGEEVQGTMRQFRDSLRDQGYRKPEDVEEAAVEEAPADNTGA